MSYHRLQFEELVGERDCELNGYGLVRNQRRGTENTHAAFTDVCRPGFMEAGCASVD